MTHPFTPEQEARIREIVAERTWDGSIVGSRPAEMVSPYGPFPAAAAPQRKTFPAGMKAIPAFALSLLDRLRRRNGWQEASPDGTPHRKIDQRQQGMRDVP